MTDEHEDLAILELNVRELMGSAGVRVSPVFPATHRAPDVFFVYPVTQPGALIEMLTVMSPAIVFVDSERFDPDDFETDDDGLRQVAQDHTDDIHRFSVVWALDGLLYEWFATADWHDELLDETAIVERSARGIGQMEYELRVERSRAAHQALLSIVVAAPEFRAATWSRRSAQAKILMDAHPELVEDMMFDNRFVKLARDAANVEIARWEAELDADDSVIPRLAEELLGVRTQAQQKQRTAEVLREMADGWTLSEAFIEQMRLSAKEYNGQVR